MSGAAAGLNEDFLDMLAALRRAGVRYLIVGAHALAVHGVPRATGDMDVLVDATEENAERVTQALIDFGAPLEAHGIQRTDFAVPGTVYQIGLPPRRIDLLTSITGVEFAEAWDDRQIVDVAGNPVCFLGRNALLKNKRATGRDKDLVDVRLLLDSKE